MTVSMEAQVLLPPQLALKEKWNLDLVTTMASYIAGQGFPPAAMTPVRQPSNGQKQRTVEQEQKGTSTKKTQVADWFAKMVCYIWFAPSLPSASSRPPSPGQSPMATYAPLHLAPSSFPSPNAFTGSNVRSTGPNLNHAHARYPSADANMLFAAELQRKAEAAQYTQRPGSSCGPRQQESASSLLRLKPQAKFVSFVRDVLNTTQVSTSVIILALLYIYRFKSMHPSVRGQEGSEFRLAIVGLMLANKFLDDNTYTNKTWSEISNIKLRDVTRMEIEFWSGLEMRINVTEQEFAAWRKRLESMTEQRSQSLARRERDLLTLNASTWHARPNSLATQAEAMATRPYAALPSRRQSPSVAASVHSSPLRLHFDMPALPPLLHHPTAASLAPIMSPASAGTWDSSATGNAPFDWSASASPTASSRTSAPPPGALRISVSPSYHDAAQAGLAQKRSFASVDSDASAHYGADGSPTWDLSHAKRFAASAGDFAAPRRLARPVDTSRPRHGYDLRSTRKLPLRQSSPHGIDSSSSSNGSFQLPPGAMQHSRPSSSRGRLAAPPSFAANTMGNFAGEGCYSLFAPNEWEAPSTLIAPFQGAPAADIKALTYYQLASGVPQGIPAYHVPAQQDGHWPMHNDQLSQSHASQHPTLPQSWTKGQNAMAWHQESFNNAPMPATQEWPHQLPASFIYRSPSQIF